MPPDSPKKAFPGRRGVVSPPSGPPPGAQGTRTQQQSQPLGWPLGRTRSRRGRSGAEWESNAVTGSSWHEVAAFGGAPRRGVKKLRAAIPARPHDFGRARIHSPTGGPIPGSRLPRPPVPQWDIHRSDVGTVSSGIVLPRPLILLSPPSLRIMRACDAVPNTTRRHPANFDPHFSWKPNQCLARVTDPANRSGALAAHASRPNGEHHRSVLPYRLRSAGTALAPSSPSRDAASRLRSSAVQAVCQWVPR